MDKLLQLSVFDLIPLELKDIIGVYIVARGVLCWPYEDYSEDNIFILPPEEDKGGFIGKIMYKVGDTKIPLLLRFPKAHVDRVSVDRKELGCEFVDESEEYLKFRDILTDIYIKSLCWMMCHGSSPYGVGKLPGKSLLSSFEMDDVRKYERFPYYLAHPLCFVKRHVETVSSFIYPNLDLKQKMAIQWPEIDSPYLLGTDISGTISPMIVAFGCGEFSFKLTGNEIEFDGTVSSDID